MRRTVATVATTAILVGLPAFIAGTEYVKAQNRTVVADINRELDAFQADVDATDAALGAIQDDLASPVQPDAYGSDCEAGIQVFEDGSWVGTGLYAWDEETGGWVTLDEAWDQRMPKWGYPPHVDNARCTLVIEGS